MIRSTACVAVQRPHDGSRFGRRLWRLALAGICLCAGCLPDQSARNLTLAHNGKVLPVVVAADAPEANREAADDLARYIGKITGTQPAVVDASSGPVPEHAIWVGSHPALAAAWPELELAFMHPEEIRMACNGRHLVIAGRDRIIEGEQTEFGTPNAVYTFLQRHLDVRWLWPGDLGTDIVENPTLTLEAFDERFHPPLRERVLRYPKRRASQAENYWWDVCQRGRGSLESDAGHAFNAWWGLYAENHPEWFALQPDDTRNHDAHRAKMCVSNPEVAAQWLENAERTLRADPRRRAIGASPTDGGGWCVCDVCESWDHPDAGEDDRGRRIMTERYVRFWNILARGLKERFPDRDVYLDVMAYARYKSPPLETQLEDNIAIAYVGHFPIIGEERRAWEKQELLDWADKAFLIKYRPNLFWYSGGVWGLPSIETVKTIEDFRFLAENRVVGLDVDSVFLNYATLGPQLYLMAQLAYDPYQDGAALLDDYYRRAFGPAASHVAGYFALMEQAHQQIVDGEGFHPGGGRRYHALLTMQEVYDNVLLEQADAILQKAADVVAVAADVYRERVEFVRVGLRFTRLQLQIAAAMDQVRATQGHDAATLEQAVALCEAREQLFDTAPPYALDHRRIMDQIQRRGMRDHLGPPTEALLDAGKAAAAGPPVRLAPADAWRLVLEDDFDRTTLGDDWEAVAGVWTVEDGALVTRAEGGVVLAARSIPGLQRLELWVEAPLWPGGPAHVSDLSPVLHANAGHPTRSGYFLQFGGGENTRNTLRRMGSEITQNAEARINPDTIHHLVAEFDGVQVRLMVDGQTVLAYDEPLPMIGAGHDRVGFYTWTGARIHRARVYQAEAREAHENLDDPDFD